MDDMQLLTVKLSQIHPYKHNPRKNDQAVDDVKESISQCGYCAPIVVDENMEVLAGHTRLKAIKKLGWKECQVCVKSGLTDEQKRKYRLLDNKTGEKAEWDFDALKQELESLDFGDFDFGFDFGNADDGSGFFNREERNDTSRQEGNDEYNEFLDKFEVKKTTDDCYTPEIVYDAIAEWVAHEYGIDRLRFVRPFYPGGDYKNYSYPAGCAVVDNPPFSILAEIISWYAERNIRFFLFAPQLTLFSSSSSSCCCLPCGVDITYENGAVVPTSFVTNLEDNRIRVIPELYKVVEAANDKNLEATRRTLPKYKYPDYVITAAMCNYMCAHDTPLTIRREDSQHIRYLDSQKEYGDWKNIFGSGYLLSEKAAAEKAAAEKAAAEKASVHVWELSEREWGIIRSLGS